MALFAQGFDWHNWFFVLFALLTCVFAVAVLVSSNIVHMAFYLTICLGATSGLFFLAGAEFVGAMQLMIYVGGTLVLLIFGVMLTARKRFISMQTRAGDWVISLGLGLLLFGVLAGCTWGVAEWQVVGDEVKSLSTTDSQSSGPIGTALSGVRFDDQSDPARRVSYVFPFIVVSVHLLVVLVGAAYLARAKRTVSAS